MRTNGACKRKDPRKRLVLVTKAAPSLSSIFNSYFLSCPRRPYRLLCFAKLGADIFTRERPVEYFALGCRNCSWIAVLKFALAGQE